MPSVRPARGIGALKTRKKHEGKNHRMFVLLTNEVKGAGEDIGGGV